MPLTTTDLALVVSRLPKDVKDLLKGHNLFVAGGFIRATIANEKPADVDLLGPSVAELSSAAYGLAATRDARVHETGNAITVLSNFRLPVQFITRWLYSDAEKLISQFDFTIVQAAVWYDRGTKMWASACAPTFYPDLAARRLVYTSPVRSEDAGGSILRVIKYIKRGYSIYAPSLAAVLAQLLSTVRWDAHGGPPVELPKEVLYQVINGLLQEVDPAIAVEGIPHDQFAEPTLNEVSEISPAPSPALNITFPEVSAEGTSEGGHENI